MLYSWQADESGSDSDGADSTSSSYSSLSDFVTDMVNSEIDGDTPGMVVLVKLSSIYRIYWNRWEYPMHDSSIYRIYWNIWGYPWYCCTCKIFLSVLALQL
jgi:hypothetical protein